MARSSRRSLFFVVFFLLACGFLGILFAQRSGQQSSITGDSDVRDSLKQFTDVYSIVEDNYAEPVNPDKAIYNGAIPGMLHALDPHSNFFDPKSYALMREDQRGKYYGVGMTVGPRNNKVIVIFPFTGTPAYKAGIHPGDVIIAVDGKSTENMSVGDVADLLKGPKGTTVHISIAREGVDKPMEFTLVRDEIPRYSVDVHFLIRPGIGYMHVTGFNETTEDEVAQALDEFGDLKGLILDLRGNPGGLLSEGRRRRRQVSEERAAHRLSPWPRLGGEALRSPARQRRERLSAGGAGEPLDRIGGRDCLRRHSGPRPWADRR